MPAPKGNTNAEKWTLEESQKFIDSVYEYVKGNEDCCSIEEACTELGWYEKLLTYIDTKFKNVVFNAIKKSKALIKQRILKQGLNNKYNPTMAIFVLKNNHDMKDKQEIHNSGSINIPPIKWVK